MRAQFLSMSLLALALFVPATTALEPRVAPERLKPATAPLATGPAATSSTDSAPSNHAVYREDRVMVRAADVARLDAIASRHGASVARPAGQAGVAALSVPAGISADAFVAALDRDPEVLTAAREGRFYGASTPPASASWHMTSISRPAQDNTLSSHIVAVLDTGVAYENYTANGKTYVRASGMNNVTIVAPLDPSRTTATRTTTTSTARTSRR